MCWLDVEDGFAVIKAMREMGLRPSRMALEALLDGCAAMNDSEQARRVVGEMEREGLALNILSMTRYLQLLAFLYQTPYIRNHESLVSLNFLDPCVECSSKDSNKFQDHGTHS